MATIEERYKEKFAKSMQWYEEGKERFAGGMTHQGRFVWPFPVYIEHADGAFKYDMDGNELIDYVMGSGSLLMGHNPPELTAALSEQLSRGTHLGGHNAHEVLYARAVQELMPSLERVRFTCSGTESTYLALRLARAYTGKKKVLKFRGHFHGWHDHVIPESGQSFGGVSESVTGDTVVAPVDTGAVARILDGDQDIAAVIVEAHGANGGIYPLQNPRFLEDLRDITAKHGVVFILDEVITGFRLSPGGAQVRWDIDPDLTTMAKVMAGGQPGGAVGGKADIMDLMAFKGDPDWDNVQRVAQAGTYNAAPITAVAGTALLDAVANQGVNAKADAAAQRLKDGLNETLIMNEVMGHAHGISSLVHVNLGAECGCDRELCTMPYDEISRTMPADKGNAVRRAMYTRGVDMPAGRKFFVSSAHSDEVVDRTIDAFDQSLKDLREEAVIEAHRVQGFLHQKVGLSI